MGTPSLRIFRMTHSHSHGVRRTTTEERRKVLEEVDAIELREINWFHTVLLTLTPALALYGYLTTPLTLPTFALALVWYYLTGMGITAGYHRLFSHKAYEAAPAIRGAFLAFGAAAFQGSARWWCRNHRAHHRYSDTSQGPLPCPGRVYVGALWVDADQAGLPTGWKGGFCRPEERSSGELPAQQLRVGRPVFRRCAPDGARLAVGGCMGCLFLRMHGPDGLGPPRHLLRQLACPLHGPAVVFHSHFCPRLGLDCAGHLWRGPPLVPPLLPHRLPQRDLLLVL